MELARFDCVLWRGHGRRFGLATHHNTYERWGQEWPEDLTILCTRCHDEMHELWRARRPA
jgi:hypothetical protein